MTRDGRIFGPRGLRKLQAQGNGYWGITYKVDGKMCVMYLHKALGETYLPNPLGLPCVNHKDGNKHNNAIDNLEWATKSYDLSHAHQMGLRGSGWEKRTRDRFGRFT